MRFSVPPAATLFVVPLLLLAGCRLPGKPGPNFVPARPDAVTNFDVLYKSNCQACHGVNGEGGTAISLSNPAYIAYAGNEHIAQITANGIGGSLMPAFVKSAGGLLTEQQVQILANGIVSRWGRPADLGGAVPPPYDSHANGDATAGEVLYKTNCLRCHAPGPSSILAPTYLSLISNGGLRTWMVAGAPHAGMPDWRGYAGGALNDEQVSDLVSFMVAHRAPDPGQPFPNAQGAPQPDDAATESTQNRQQQLNSEAGPATGGLQASQHAAPTATPKHPVGPKP